MRTLALFVAALAVAGCATIDPTPDAAGVVSAGELPRTIAVLPLVPLADKEEPARVLGRMIYGTLSATAYDVLKPQVVEQRLVGASLADPRAVAAKDPSELARILRVDGLVYGEMTHYDRLFLVAYSQVAAGAGLWLVDARNGRTLFERREVARTHEGGVPLGPVSAVMTVVQTAMNLREIELVRACDDLVRKLLEGIPTPPVREALRPPALTHVFSDGAGRVLKAGDTLGVVVSGARGAIGAFDVVSLATGLSLEETQEGVYVGRFTIKPGQNAADAYVVARLADAAGRVSEREDVLGRFVVDSQPPSPPRGLAVGLPDGHVHVSWAANSEGDLAGYRVYRSDSPLTGFTAIAATEAPVHREALAALAYYRVTAVDRAGNESPPTATVTLPVLSSPLSGTVSRDVYLVPSKSPYLLQGAVTIEGGATLHVLPGVVVRFAPGSEGVVVKDGALVARGRAGQAVVFQSGSDRPAAGDYRAAVRVRAGNGQMSVLEHVSVEHAAVALVLESGGLEVLAGELVGNRQGGIEVADTGVLKLSDSRIAGHAAGAAVTVRGFGRAVLRGNRIVDNGWAVVNYSGSPVDARGNWWGAAVPADGLFVGEVDRGEPLADVGGR